jgi:hypothetical protein
MFTIEEFAVIAAATALGLLCIYALLHTGFVAYTARKDRLADDADETARRQDIGNDINTIIHHGRG